MGGTVRISVSRVCGIDVTDKGRGGRRRTDSGQGSFVGLRVPLGKQLFTEQKARDVSVCRALLGPQPLRERALLLRFAGRRGLRRLETTSRRLRGGSARGFAVAQVGVAACEQLLTQHGAAELTRVGNLERQLLGARRSTSGRSRRGVAARRIAAERGAE